MSAPSMAAVSRRDLMLPPVFRDSRYQSDSEHSPSLLAVTCSEQQGRLHTLNLLSEYLASGAGGRKRQLVTREMQALSELYEVVWCELGCAFSDRIISSARTAVEHEAVYRGMLAREEMKQLSE
jgi:hypothetical protein